jgi:hypothetical protein
MSEEGAVNPPPADEYEPLTAANFEAATEVFNKEGDVYNKVEKPEKFEDGLVLYVKKAAADADADADAAGQTQPPTNPATASTDANAAANAAASTPAVEGGKSQPTNEEQQKLFESVMRKSIDLMVGDGEMTKEFASKLPNLTDEQKTDISEIVVRQGEVDPNATKKQPGGRRRTKRKDRKGSRKSRKGVKKGAKKSKKSSQSKKGGRRRSSKNRRKHSRRLKH